MQIAVTQLTNQSKSFNKRIYLHRQARRIHLQNSFNEKRKTLIEEQQNYQQWLKQFEIDLFHNHTVNSQKITKLWHYFIDEKYQIFTQQFMNELLQYILKIQNQINQDHTVEKITSQILWLEINWLSKKQKIPLFCNQLIQFCVFLLQPIFSGYINHLAICCLGNLAAFPENKKQILLSQVITKTFKSNYYSENTQDLTFLFINLINDIPSSDFSKIKPLIQFVITQIKIFCKSFPQNSLILIKDCLRIIDSLFYYSPSQEIFLELSQTIKQIFDKIIFINDINLKLQVLEMAQTLFQKLHQWNIFKQNAHIFCFKSLIQSCQEILEVSHTIEQQYLSSIWRFINKLCKIVKTEQRQKLLEFMFEKCLDDTWYCGYESNAIILLMNYYNSLQIGQFCTMKLTQFMSDSRVCIVILDRLKKEFDMNNINNKKSILEDIRPILLRLQYSQNDLISKLAINLLQF